MIQNEIMQSDIIYFGGKVVPISEFKNEFPDWYEMWDKYSREETADQYILISDYDYGISATINAFYFIDFNKATADFICRFDDDRNEGGLYHPPIRIGNRLIFAPNRAHRWAYYDLDTDVWSYENIPAKLLPENEGIFVRSWKPIKDSLIYMPGENGVIVKLDYKTGAVSYHDCLKKKTQAEQERIDISSMSAYKDSVLFFSGTGDIVHEIDVECMAIKKTHRIGEMIKGVKSAFAIPKTDWIFLIENPDLADAGDWKTIYKWNIKSGELYAIKNLPVNPCIENTKHLISGFCHYNGDLYAIPQQGDCFVRIDVHTDQTERIEIAADYNLLDRKNDFYRRWGDGLTFPMLNYNGFENTFTATLPYDFSIAEIYFDEKMLRNKRKWRVSGIERQIRNTLAGRWFDGGFFENEFYSLKEFIGDML